MSNKTAMEEARETYVLPEDPSPYKHAEVSILREGFVKGYEAARAKDAELIQQLVDALEWVAAYDNGCPLPTWEKGYNNAWSIANSAREAAKAAGFKHSEQ